jgi:hypothetical protein
VRVPLSEEQTLAMKIGAPISSGNKATNSRSTDFDPPISTGSTDFVFTEP